MPRIRTRGDSVNALDFLSDRDDPRIQAALQDSCGVCGVPAGADCVHPVTGQLMDHIVHLARVNDHWHEGNH